MSNASTKELLKKFGFPYHTAPGEAEAECALLQKHRIVDAVLSEDVDTLMFGCTKSLRHWTAEGARGNKEPTHVNLYDAESLKNDTGLESEGMILVALMSGGDYIPAGVPGCGPKTACEAAKAGFGMDLCRIPASDAVGLNAWRERLQRELRTNESKFFRRRHKAMTIPEKFPDLTVLSYYKSPAVSSLEDLSKLRKEIQWNQDVDAHVLRAFVGEQFNWPNLGGAKKFIRGLAPALLAHRLYHRSTIPERELESYETKEQDEFQLVKAICGRRAHWNTDGMQELKIAYVPADIAGLDLDAEGKGDELDIDQDLSGGEQIASGDEEAVSRSRSSAKRRAPSRYDPYAIEKIWILETHVKLGVPLLVETWEEEMRNPKNFTSKKARERKVVEKGGTKAGAVDRFVKVSKVRLHRNAFSDAASKYLDNQPSPPVFLAPATALPLASASNKAASENRRPVGEKTKKKSSAKDTSSKAGSTAAPPSSQPLSSSPPNSTSNPWTLSRRPCDTLGFKSPTRYSALGIYAPGDPEHSLDQVRQRQPKQGTQQNIISPPASPTPRKRRSRPTTPLFDSEASSTHVPSAINVSVESSNLKHLPTPTHHDPSKPSPRKKRSPLRLASDTQLFSQLRTPTSNRSEKQSDVSALEEEESLTARRVNRKLEFAAATTSLFPASPASDASDLPCPLALSSTVTLKKSNTFASTLPSTSTKQVLPIEGKIGKKLIALRESLEGSWKHLEPWEAVGAGKGVYTGVEVLDLTG